MLRRGGKSSPIQTTGIGFKGIITSTCAVEKKPGKKNVEICHKTFDNTSLYPHRGPSVTRAWVLH